MFQGNIILNRLRRLCQGAMRCGGLVLLLFAVALGVMAAPEAAMGAPPAKVTVLRVAPYPDNVVIVWRHLADADSYDLRYRKDGSGDWSEITSKILPHVGTNVGNTVVYRKRLLRNGQIYEFQVRAVNDKGEKGPWSEVVSAAPVLAPGLLILAEPRTFSESGERIKVTFIFSEPVSGFGIDDIKVTNGEKPKELTAHSDGQVYTGVFTTGAKKAAMRFYIDEGVATVLREKEILVENRKWKPAPLSSMSFGVEYAPLPTGSGVPEKPWGVEAFPGDGKITLTWENPGDSSITKWQFKKYNPQGGMVWEEMSGGADISSYEFTGLANGITHYYQIRAVNGNGEGGDTWAFATPIAFGARALAVPALPQRFEAERGNERIVLSWADPGDNSILEWQYQLYIFSDMALSLLPWSDIPNSERPHDILRGAGHPQQQAILRADQGGEREQRRGESFGMGDRYPEPCRCPGQSRGLQRRTGRRPSHPVVGRSGR